MDYKGMMVSAKYAVNRGGLILVKHSPTILLWAGIVGNIGAIATGFIATRKLDSTLESSDVTLDYLHRSRDNMTLDQYSDKEYQQDLAKAYLRRGIDVVALYGPTIALELLSIGCLIGGNHILSKRNAGVMAAYALLDKSYKEYRARVESEVGAEKENDLRHNIVSKEVDPETGVSTASLPDKGGYVFYFDPSNPNWKDFMEDNVRFLQSSQNYANDRLNATGHLFLNDVRRSLGLKDTDGGAVTGWVKDSKKGDSQVDFRLFDPNNGWDETFANCWIDGIGIDPNVDGVIWNLLDSQ